MHFYAGGNASIIYRSWPQHLHPQIEAVAVELPGRAARFGEPPVSDCAALVGAIADAFEATPGYLPGGAGAAGADGGGALVLPYGLFGHSMGALLAFELAHALRARGHPPPVCLVASGARAPQVPRRRPAGGAGGAVGKMGDEAILAHLRKMVRESFAEHWFAMKAPRCTANT